MANTKSSAYLNHSTLLWLQWVWEWWCKLLCPHDGGKISQCLASGLRSRHLKTASLEGRTLSLLQTPQSACVRLAPSQYNTALQSREKRSNRLKILQTGEKEQEHSLGSLSKNKNPNKRQRGNGKQWMVCYSVYKPTSNICRSSIPFSLEEEIIGPRVKLQQSLSPPKPLLFCLQNAQQQQWQK